MTVKEILQSFYENLAKKNNDGQKNLSENVVFSDAGMRLHAEGKDAFIQSFTGFLQSVEMVKDSISSPASVRQEDYGERPIYFETGG